MAHCRVDSAEFKQQAVQLTQQPGSTNQGTLHDLGISQSALSGWIKAAREHGSLAFPGQGIVRLTPNQETIKRLKQELKILHQEIPSWMSSSARFLAAGWLQTAA
jgi:transposase